MCKKSEQPVRNLSIRRVLYRPFRIVQTSYTHMALVLPKLSTNLCAKFCTARTTLFYLFEQLLYPTSTALIITIIIKDKRFKGVCA
jgi:hypothetical protein